MGAWTREELLRAFAQLQSATDECFAMNRPDALHHCFTDDVTFRDFGFGFSYGWQTEARGQAAVTEWIGVQSQMFPLSELKYRTVAWNMVDVERGWLVCEWRNRMTDPGSGEVFEEKSYSRLKYAGDGRWGFREDVYNTQRLTIMMNHWLRARDQAKAAGKQPPAVDLRWGKHIHDSEHEVDQRWSRAEIADALQHFADVCQRAFTSGDHKEWEDCFTQDVIYRELGFGFEGGWREEVRGHDEVSAWINSHCAIYPIDHMKYFPITWHVIDEERGWVVLEWRNQMADPGDGQLIEEKSYTRLKYGGNKRWRFEEDIYDPIRMRMMLLRWLEARRYLTT